MVTKYRILQITGILTLFLQLSCSLENPIPIPNTSVPIASEVFYKGTNMAYVSHQETYGNVVFKENGVAKGAFQRIANHGRIVIRLRIDTPFLIPATILQGMQMYTLTRQSM